MHKFYKKDNLKESKKYYKFKNFEYINIQKKKLYYESKSNTFIQK